MIIQNCGKSCCPRIQYFLVHLFGKIGKWEDESIAMFYKRRQILQPHMMRQLLQRPAQHSIARFLYQVKSFLQTCTNQSEKNGRGNFHSERVILHQVLASSATTCITKTLRLNKKVYRHSFSGMLQGLPHGDRTNRQHLLAPIQCMYAQFNYHFRRHPRRT